MSLSTDIFSREPMMVLSRWDRLKIPICPKKELVFFFFLDSFLVVRQKWSPDLKLVTGWKAHDYPVYAMTSNNKSTLFTSATDGEIKEWDTKSGEFKQMTLMIVSPAWLYFVLSL